jgi:hypothetical protein
MAVLSFTAGDALQTVMVEAGQYPSVLTKIEGPKASSSGKSVSYIGTIQITDGKFKGKEKDVMFNSGIRSGMLNGDLQMLPTSDFLVIDAAIRGAKVEAVAKNIDTDDLINKPLDTVWGVQTVDGKLVNEIVGFRPVGSGNVGF